MKIGSLSDNTQSWLNSPTFIGAWNIILGSNVWIKSDFTVKADPDAVFFPERLRPYLKFHPNFRHHNPWFSTNCKFGENNEKDALFGSLEVFNKKSMKELSTKAKICKEELPWLRRGWGEDRYIQECMMQIVEASHSNMERELKDNACGHAKQPKKKYTCDESAAVAYHPYKTLGEWKQCYETSVGTTERKRGGQVGPKNFEHAHSTMANSGARRVYSTTTAKSGARVSWQCIVGVIASIISLGHTGSSLPRL